MKKILILSLVLALGSFPAAAFAEIVEEEVYYEEETMDEPTEYDYASGTVMEVSDGSILINETVFEEDPGTAYVVIDETELMGAESLDDIGAGTEVEIDYVTDEDGNNIAMSITIVPAEEAEE